MTPRQFAILGWAALAVVLLLGLREAIVHEGGGFPIAQYGANLPTLEMQRWWMLWWVLGTAAALSLARSFFLGSDSASAREQFVRFWEAGSDRAWATGATGVAFSAAVAVCWGLLGGRHIVVDESAYLFMARVMATGRLYIPSYAESGFYDRGFMVNDGKFYAQYFVGWPAMLAPFARFGLEAWANPVWFAATVPGMFFVLRRLVGSTWARFGVLLFATSPLVVFSAGTQMAHVGCTFWLVWCLWFAHRALDDDRPWWAPVGVGFAISAAFFVRPTTALGIAGPVVVWWVVSAARRRDRLVWRDALAFVVPAAGLAWAFLEVNRAQTGDPFMVAYTRAAQFTTESMFLQDRGGVGERALEYHDTWRVFTGPLTSLYRLDYALFGWPSSFFFVPFGVRAAGGRLAVAMALGMLVVHLFASDPGIMAYGPVHYLEFVVPTVLLTVLGLRAIHQVEVPEWAGRAGFSLMAALCLISVVGYWPWRVQNLAHIGRATAVPYDLVEGLGPSVVFCQNGRWLPHCVDPKVAQFHTSRPDNPPDLDARVLWVNHVGVPHDKAFVARHHPDRKGYILSWDEACVPHLHDLDALGPDDYPPNFRPAGMTKFDYLLTPGTVAP